MKITTLPRFMRGFTLLELMVTVVIAAILISLAVPSFTNLLRRNQITTYANEFATTINLARSEAVKRGTNVTISSNNGLDWTQGWTLTVDATAELLRAAPALTGDNTFVSDNNNAFSFNSRGSTNLGGEETLLLCNTNVITGRQIRIAVTGRISVRETPC